MSEFVIGLKLFLENAGNAKIVLDAIKPELMEEKRNRSKTEIKVNKSILSINIKARDKTALKASINSYLKGINLSKKIIDLKEEK